MPNLFDPLQIGPLRLRNRIVMAPMTRTRAGAERLPSIGADANLSGSRINPGQFGGALPPGVNIDRLQASFGANVTARWDPDLFGGLRAQERAARLRITAADAGAAAVRRRGASWSAP